VWDIDGKTELHRFEFAEAWKGRFSPDGKLLACASQLGTVKLWELSGKWPARELHAHQTKVEDLAFFPDGKTLATASHDRTAKLWNIATLELVTTLRGQFESAGAIAVAPDGSRVAVATGEGTVALWIPDRNQPIPVATLRGNS